MTLPKQPQPPFPFYRPANTRVWHQPSLVKAKVLTELQDGVRSAGCTWTGSQIGQIDFDYDDWSSRAKDAQVIIVLFTPEYMHKFSAGLMAQARLIHSLAHSKSHPVRVYIIDEASVPEVTRHLRQHAPTMGSFDKVMK